MVLSPKSRLPGPTTTAPQPKLVDEIVFQQHLNQVAAPGHLDFAAGLLFEPRDICGDILGN
jgi:hypothetical protein